MPEPLGDFSYTWPFLAVAIGGYLVGSIPFGLILTRLGGIGDLRAIGSGSIGATNVLRTGHKGLAAATVVLDGAKGALPIVVANLWLTHDFAVLAGAGAFLGHLFPLWLGFSNRDPASRTVISLVALAMAFALAASGRPPLGLSGFAIALVVAYWGAWGGKGVATGLGALLALSWVVGVGACITWLIVAALFRYSSLAGLLTFIAAPLYAWFLADMPRSHTGFAIFLATFVIVRHKTNIGRLIRGTEPRIGRKESDSPPSG